MKHITRQALRVNTYERRAKFRWQIAELQSKRFLSFAEPDALEAVNAKASETAREIRFRYFVQLKI